MRGCYDMATFALAWGGHITLQEMHLANAESSLPSVNQSRVALANIHPSPLHRSLDGTTKEQCHHWGSCDHQSTHCHQVLICQSHMPSDIPILTV